VHNSSHWRLASLNKICSLRFVKLCLEYRMRLTNDSAVSPCLPYQRLMIDLKCHKCHFTPVQMTGKIRDSRWNIFCRLIDDTEIVQHRSNTVQIADRLLSASRTILKGWVPVCSCKLHSVVGALRVLLFLSITSEATNTDYRREEDHEQFQRQMRRLFFMF